MNVLLGLLLVFSSVVLATNAEDCPTNQKVIFCYYSSWAIYRKEDGTFTISDIDPSLCTHFVYAFSGLSQYGGIEALDTYYDINLGGYTDFVALKEQNPCAKTLLAIGGWNQGSRRFSLMASGEGYREAFVDSVARYVMQYEFDGLDFDWEYPSQRGGIAEDKENFGLLLKKIKETIGKWDLLLTIAVPISTAIAEAAYDMDMINEYVDYVLIMGYDYTPTDSSVTGLLSPLNEIDKSVQFWTKSVASSKVVLGVPAYGRSFTLKDISNYGIGAETSGPGVAGDFTGEPGFLSYQEVQSKVQSGLYKIVSVPEAQNYYAYNGNDWISFETAENYVAKAKYALENDLGGVMIWSIDTDIFNGDLNSTFAITNTIKDTLYG